MKVRTRPQEREARRVSAATVVPVMEWINAKPGSTAAPARAGGSFDPGVCVLVVDSGGYRFGAQLGDWLVEVGDSFHRVSDDQFWAMYEGL